MTALEGANLGLRLVLEMCVLVALAYWGFTTFLLLGIVAPAVAALTWGTFVAPRAKIRLDDPARLAVEIVFFAAGGVALMLSGLIVPGVLLLVAVAAHVGLMLALKQR